MRMHVEQLEKDKRESAERVRVIGRWLDHVERAYRKEERPLLAKDYEAQQENDRLTFEALQKSRIEGSKQQHQLGLETKARLSRMLVDFERTKNEVLERRGQEYAEKQKVASEKLHEAKVKRTNLVKKAREEERLRKEAEEQKLREREEEEARREAGVFPSALGINLHADLTLIARLEEEGRLRREKEAEEAAEEAKRKEEEERLRLEKEAEEEKRAALLEARRREREEAERTATLQRQREEEAEKRRAERHAAAKSQPPSNPPTPWRRSTPQGTTPSTPPRSESPAPARYRPGAFAAARTQQQVQTPERTSSPAPTRNEDTWQRRGPSKTEDSAPKWRSRVVEERKADEDPSNPPTPQTDADGFQTVEKKAVWRPKGRGGPRS